MSDISPSEATAGSWVPAGRAAGGSTGSARGRAMAWSLAPAVGLPALLTVLDITCDVRLSQLLLVGPCLAAVTARPRAVALNVVYVLVLMTYLGWPNHTVDTVQQAFTTVAGIGIGAVCVLASARRSRLERSVVETEWRRGVLAGIVESSVEAVVGCRLDGTITNWNAAAERLYGYPAAAAVGRNIRMLYPAEPEQSLQEIRDRVVAGESIEQQDTTRVDSTGRQLDVAVTTSPMRGPDGAVIGAASLASDIGPRKRLAEHQAALTDQVHQLQRVESLGQLAGGIAHDFNNLLAVIISSAEFIEGEVDDPVAVRSDAAQLKSAAERAATLTRQLLQFARGDHLPPAVLDIDQLIDSLEPMLAHTAGPDIDLLVHPSAAQPSIYADAGRIEQVLLNLVLNARDAMPDGGRILITTEVTGGAETDDGAADPTSPGSGVRILVADSGSGMSPEVAERVFEPFFTTRDRNRRAGLGLASAHGIVTEARGHIDMESAPGIGTTVLVDFPLVAGAPGRVRQPPADPGPDAPVVAFAAGCVLVVDDEQLIGEVVARLLRRAGYEVLLATSGPQALVLAADHEVDLLVSDVVMPGMSGRVLAARLLEDRPGLPVLFMSGYSDGVLDRAGTDRAADLLSKPFTEPQLLARVYAALTRTARTGPHVGQVH